MMEITVKELLIIIEGIGTVCFCLLAAKLADKQKTTIGSGCLFSLVAWLIMTIIVVIYWIILT
jgi:hypothetical protein